MLLLRGTDREYYTNPLATQHNPDAPRLLLLDNEARLRLHTSVVPVCSEDALSVETITHVRSWVVGSTLDAMWIRHVTTSTFCEFATGHSAENISFK